MRVIYIAPKNLKQTHRRSHCTSAKRMTSILRHVAEAFFPAIIVHVCSLRFIISPSRFSKHNPRTATVYLSYTKICIQCSKLTKPVDLTDVTWCIPIFSMGECGWKYMVLLALSTGCTSVFIVLIFYSKGHTLAFANGESGTL